MTKLSLYEKEYAEEDFEISGYYKKDYASLKRWITLLWVTVGYALAVILVVVCCAQELVEGITFFRLFVLAGGVVGGYLVLLILYGIGSDKFYKDRYESTKQRIRDYYRDLCRLEKQSKKESDR